MTRGEIRLLESYPGGNLRWVRTLDGVFAALLNPYIKEAKDLAGGRKQLEKQGLHVFKP